MRTILALRRGGLGDLLVAAPSIRLLRLAFPEAGLVLIARRKYGHLLRQAGIVEAVEDADDFRWACLSDSSANPPSILIEADSVVGWFHTKSAGDFRKGTAALRSAAAFRADLGAGRPLSRQFFEATAGFCRKAQHPLESFESCALLPAPAAPLPVAASSLRRPYAVVHPGAGSAAKLWPGDRFREAVRAAADRRYAGAIVFGEADEALRCEWSAFPLPPGWILLDRPDLSSLAALLSGASVYLGNDSGVTHLAAALGTPGLAVFRSEFVHAWRPYGLITAVDAPDVRDISAASIREQWPILRG